MPNRVFVMHVHAGGRFPGSPQSFASLRSQVAGIWNACGLFTSFVTLNPSPLTCAPFFTMVGKPYTFDATGKPIDRPSMVDRWVAVAQNSVHAAIMFHITMESFTEVFMGWPPGARQQLNADCIMGQVIAHFWKYETTGRADLHAHGNMVQPDLQVARMLQLMREDPVGLAKFLEAIMCHDVVEVPPDLKVDRTAEPKPSAYRVPLDGSCDQVHIMAALGNAQLDVQVHNHTRTCAKNGGGANDMLCRVGIPRPATLTRIATKHDVQGGTMVIAGSQSVIVGCNHPHVAPHIVALLLAFGTAHEPGSVGVMRSQWLPQRLLHMVSSQAYKADQVTITQGIDGLCKRC